MPALLVALALVGLSPACDGPEQAPATATEGAGAWVGSGADPLSGWLPWVSARIRSA